VDVMTRRTYLSLEVDELFKLFRADKASTQLAKPVKHVASLTQGPYYGLMGNKSLACGKPAPVSPRRLNKFRVNKADGRVIKY